MNIGRGAKIGYRGLTGLERLSDMRPPNNVLKSMGRINPLALTAFTPADSTFANLCTGYKALTWENLTEMKTAAVEQFVQAASFIQHDPPRNPFDPSKIIAAGGEFLNLLIGQLTDLANGGLTVYNQAAASPSVSSGPGQQDIPESGNGLKLDSGENDGAVILPFRPGGKYGRRPTTTPPWLSDPFARNRRHLSGMLAPYSGQGKPDAITLKGGRTIDAYDLMWKGLGGRFFRFRHRHYPSAASFLADKDEVWGYPRPIPDDPLSRFVSRRNGQISEKNLPKAFCFWYFCIMRLVSYITNRSSSLLPNEIIESASWPRTLRHNLDNDQIKIRETQDSYHLSEILSPDQRWELLKIAGMRSRGLGVVEILAEKGLVTAKDIAFTEVKWWHSDLESLINRQGSISMNLLFLLYHGNMSAMELIADWAVQYRKPKAIAIVRAVASTKKSLSREHAEVVDFARSTLAQIEAEEQKD